MACERIEELTAITATGTVDRVRGVLRGVKVLGLQSRNGRTYSLEALRNGIGLYEGAKVNVDHPAGSSQPRRYQDRLGRLANVELRSDGLYANLHFNPKHPVAEQLLWDAENGGGGCGLSHNVAGRTSTNGGKVTVEEISCVYSVDLVADPATTNGLFEGSGEPGAHQADFTAEDFAEAVTGRPRRGKAAEFSEVVREDRPDPDGSADFAKRIIE